MAEKPDDRWAIPLSRACHMRQHAYGDELGWWSAHGKDPFVLALQYNALYANETGKRADEPVKVPKRKTRITRRKNPWPVGRKIASKGFPKTKRKFARSK